MKNLSTRRTRKRGFPTQMKRAVPWSALTKLVAPQAPAYKTGRQPLPMDAMLGPHFMQHWSTRSDPAMEDAPHEAPMLRESAAWGWDSRLPDGSTILRLRHLLEQHRMAEQILATINCLLPDKGQMLEGGSVVDANSIVAPSSAKTPLTQPNHSMVRSRLEMLDGRVRA